MVSFSVNKQERELIVDIADRAVRMAKKADSEYNRQEAEMDITATHANGCPLRLKELRDADDFNFAHDVFGIRRHLNRSTGKLDGLFVPRFS